MRVSVNLSSRNLQDPELVCVVLAALEPFPDLDRSRLEFEITESQEIAHFEVARRTMPTLRKEGIQFYLDDFGTGYSSSDHLKRLPLEGIKIDQQFVMKMLKNTTDLAIVESMLGIVRAFDVGVLAEGVETASVAKLLVDIGCIFAQGYLYSSALAPAEFEAYARAHQALAAISSST